MSLKIYSHGDEVPVRVEKFNDVFFDLGVLLEDKKEVRDILRIVEKGSYYDEKSFLDRSGSVMDTTKLSTGSKTLLNIALNPDKCFDTVECGYNALEAMLYIIKNGHVYCEYPSMFVTDIDECDIDWYGRHYTSVERFLEDVERRYRYLEI